MEAARGEEGVVTRGKKRKLVEEEEENKRMFFPLLRLMKHLPGVFEEGVISRLNGTDLKFFARANKRCQEVVRRAKKDEKAEKKFNFRVEELSSTSTLKWAWEEGFLFCERYSVTKKEHFISLVDREGNVDLLRWLQEVENCPWNEDTCTLAASNGQLSCLKYAHENECPLIRDCWAWYRNEHIEEYLREHNCPRNSN